jgi:hypothetical protein
MIFRKTQQRRKNIFIKAAPRTNSFKNKTNKRVFGKYIYTVKFFCNKLDLNLLICNKSNMTTFKGLLKKHIKKNFYRYWLNIHDKGQTFGKLDAEYLGHREIFIFKIF